MAKDPFKGFKLGNDAPGQYGLFRGKSKLSSDIRALQLNTRSQKGRWASNRSMPMSKPAGDGTTNEGFNFTPLVEVGPNDVAGARAVLKAEARSASVARKAWEESLHPRNEKGRFTFKATLEKRAK